MEMLEGIIDFIKKNLRLLLGASVVILVLAVIITTVIRTGDDSTKVRITDQTFNAQVARTDAEKQIGLSETEVLGESDGMLFVFDEPDFYSFWMKDMKFPIDIIYINGDKITTIIKNASPSSSAENLVIYQPKEKSDKVFEINAGLADQLNLKEGMTINIESL